MDNERKSECDRCTGNNGTDFVCKKDSEISKMFQYAGNRHWLTVFGMILAGK